MKKTIARLRELGYTVSIGKKGESLRASAINGAMHRVTLFKNTVYVGAGNSTSISKHFCGYKEDIADRIALVDRLLKIVENATVKKGVAE